MLNTHNRPLACASIRSASWHLSSTWHVRARGVVPQYEMSAMMLSRIFRAKHLSDSCEGPCFILTALQTPLQCSMFCLPLRVRLAKQSD